MARKRIVRPHCGIFVLRKDSQNALYFPIPNIPPLFEPKAFDPELLYVECGRCGAPVLWEHGRATILLKEAGIDPLELDASCLLITDACPMCSSKKKQYTVQIFRVSTTPEQMHKIGNA